MPAVTTSQTLTLAPPERRLHVAASPDVVSVDHLTKRFGSLVAVDDLTFGLEAGLLPRFWA